MRRSSPRWPLCTVVAVVLAAAWLAPCATAAAQVVVFPIPGSRYNRPATQITFRGVAPGQIGPIQVVGSKTGPHSGHLVADSDGQGASFIPDQRFASGETVTVATNLNVLGGSGGRFSFTIANALGLLGAGKLPVASAGPNGVQRFRSRPDLQPASVTVTHDAAPASEGDFFLAPQFGPTQNGPMILDSQGNLVWFLPLPVSENLLVTDFQVQNLRGQPVLTWWQGTTNSGHGRGEGVIFNRDYQQIATVKAANGLDAGLHEFLLSPQGDAYLTSTSPVRVPGITKPTIDAVVQEIDINTGNVLFEWHALDHIPLSQSYVSPKAGGYIFDPYHINSIALDRDGNLIVSMRNTSAIYKIDHRSGRIIWTLGGKASSFKMGPGAATWGQHDAQIQPDGTLTAFDDGSGLPNLPFRYDARGVRERIDTKHMLATLIRAYPHSPPLATNFEGNVQVLSDGDLVLGWGQQPYFSEYTPSGRQIFDAHFSVPTSSYRVYRFPWSAQPPTSPALAAALGANGLAALYASWNGATDVALWRVLAGPSAGSLHAIARAPRRGFETELAAHSVGPYFAVQALGSGGGVLATSPVRAVPPHVAIFGASSFVSAGGVGGLPVGCYTGNPCRVSATVAAGRTTLAHTGGERLPAGAGGIVYFQLSAGGRRLLAGAPGRRLPAQVTVQDSSGARATATINLIRFSTGGPGPRRSFRQTQALQLIGGSDFVSSRGIGGILSQCLSATPCRASTVISAGRTVIARTGPEYLDAGELGYLIFSLSAHGRALLARAAGNQLPVTVSVSGGGQTASAEIALIAFR
jgi:hypothetical protein